MLDAIGKIMLDLHDICKMCKHPLVKYICSLLIIFGMAATIGVGIGLGINIGG